MERSCCGVALNQTVICHLIQRVIDFILCHYMHNYAADKGLVENITHIMVIGTVSCSMSLVMMVNKVFCVWVNSRSL